MVKHSKVQVSDQTAQEALGIAKNIQRSGQTKEQTKLVAQGIEKGIDIYKKQQKAKARELDKALKKAKQTPTSHAAADAPVISPPPNRLAWVLLACSWALFILVVVGLSCRLS